MNEKREKVAIIGLGYVGLPLALLTDQKGYDVLGIDINEKNIDLIKDKKSPFVDEEVTKELKDAKMTVSTDFSGVADADIVIICVPTPVYDNHVPNLGPVRGACESIAPYMKKGQLIILESTVNPSVSEDIVMPILEQESGLKCGVDFNLAHCPERINPGDPKWTVKNINRVVGAYTKKGLARAVTFYENIIDGVIKPMNSLKEAEAVKVVENSFRDINIAFVNELAMSFSRLGIDVVNVIEGAATKPFAFIPHYPGCGVGGHCIPVDPYYLIDYAKTNGDFEHDFLAIARRINRKMPRFAAKQVLHGLNDNNIAIKDTKVSVLGLSYKANIGDYRESPSFDIIDTLKRYGANVCSYDPYVQELSTAKSLDEALDNARAIIVATDHKDFIEISPQLLKDSGVMVVIDGRNCLDKNAFIKEGLYYRGIGR